MSDDTLRAALLLVDEAIDEAIFDLPIGEDVRYSRGYSAGVAAARESLREAIGARIALAASATDERIPEGCVCGADNYTRPCPVHPAASATDEQT